MGLIQTYDLKPARQAPTLVIVRHTDAANLSRPHDGPVPVLPARVVHVEDTTLCSEFAEGGVRKPLVVGPRIVEGEIDLVVRNATTIVFCEVKTRATNAFGTPAEAVTPAKQARLRRMAGRYLAETSERAADLRFDVAAVMGGKVEVIEGAF